MSSRIILWFAVVVMAVEALIMNNIWALGMGMGMVFAIVGILLERKEHENPSS
jgi:hypothetical protein